MPWVGVIGVIDKAISSIVLFGHLLAKSVIKVLQQLPRIINILKKEKKKKG